MHDATWEAEVHRLDSTLGSGFHLRFRAPLSFQQLLYLMSPGAHKSVKLLPSDVASYSCFPISNYLAIFGLLRKTRGESNSNNTCITDY